MFKIKEKYNREWLKHYGFQKNRDVYEVVWPYAEISLQNDSNLFQITTYSADSRYTDVDSLLELIYRLSRDGVIEFEG